MTVTGHKNEMILMRVGHFMEELIPPGWQIKLSLLFLQSCIQPYHLWNYKGFYQVVLDFIWVVYNLRIRVQCTVCCERKVDDLNQGRHPSERVIAITMKN
jgi:hypothetical protein